MRPESDLFQNQKNETIPFSDFQQFSKSLPIRNQRISILIVGHGTYQVELVTLEPNYPIPISENSLTLTQIMENSSIPETETKTTENEVSKELTEK